MENIIKINKLGYNYGEGWILHDLSVEIAQGDFVAVIGPNGAGKSTLLRLLAGILQPTSGEIELYGTPLPQFKAWEKIGYVPQNPAKPASRFPNQCQRGYRSGPFVWQQYVSENFPGWQSQSGNDAGTVLSSRACAS